jgi:hypothetical protein
MNEFEFEAIGAEADEIYDGTLNFRLFQTIMRMAGRSPALERIARPEFEDQVEGLI